MFYRCILTVYKLNYTLYLYRTFKKFGFFLIYIYTYILVVVVMVVFNNAPNFRLIAKENAIRLYNTGI